MSRAQDFGIESWLRPINVITCFHCKQKKYCNVRIRKRMKLSYVHDDLFLVSTYCVRNICIEIWWWPRTTSYWLSIWTVDVFRNSIRLVSCSSVPSFPCHSLVWSGWTKLKIRYRNIYHSAVHIRDAVVLCQIWKLLDSRPLEDTCRSWHSEIHTRRPIKIISSVHTSLNIVIVFPCKKWNE